MPLRGLLLMTALFSLSGSAPAAEKAEAPAGPVTLRVLTYNIHHGRGLDQKLDLGRIAKGIGETRADLVALQEVEVNSSRTGKVDQPAVLGGLLKMKPAFGQSIPFGGGSYGNALLSRFPITEPEVLRLPPGGEPRTCLIVAAQVPGAPAPLVFMSTHLEVSGATRVPGSIRQRQVEAIVERAAKFPAEQTLILAGDFNCEPGDVALEPLAAAGWIPATPDDGKTYPAGAPDIRIDHIFVRPGKARCRVVESGVAAEAVASDHRPAWCVLQLEFVR